MLFCHGETVSREGFTVWNYSLNYNIWFYKLTDEGYPVFTKLIY